jgi:hypothetical protein
MYPKILTLITFSLFFSIKLFSQNCDCTIFPISENCKSKCGIWLLQKGSETQLKKILNLDTVTIKKIIKSPNRKSQKSVYSFKKYLPKKNYESLKNKYNSWISPKSINQKNVYGDNVAGNKIINNVTYLTDKETNESIEFKKILITPEVILVPAYSSRDVPIVITNNFPFPVFMSLLEVQLEEGNFNFITNPIMLGSGTLNEKFMTCHIPQINSGESFTYIWKINGDSSQNHIKIKLAITKYCKEPAPNFSIGNIQTLPKTIQVPEGLMPIFYDNK